MIARRIAAAAAALFCLFAIVGCGGSGSSNSAAGVGPDIGVTLRLADCDDWNQADVSERLGTVQELSNFAGGPTGSPAGHGTTLSTKRGYDVLDGWCKQSYAHGFKLYKLYTRAAAFSNVVPQG